MKPSQPATGLTSNQDGVATVRQVGGALPSRRPAAGRKRPDRYAEAVDRIMTEKNLTGTKGREQAQHLLAEMEPSLVQGIRRFASGETVSPAATAESDH